MSKPLPPKNTPFKDLLSELRERLISEKKQDQPKERINKFINTSTKKNSKSPQVTKQLTDKDIKRILRSNYSGPPIVIRKSVQTKPINFSQKKVTESSTQESKLSISKIPNPPIKFSWVKNQKATQYQFNYSRGMQFQPTQYSEDEIREIAIGFDFGTSSTKLTIRDRQASNSFAISFGQTQGVDGYLLPSKIYQVGDLFKLEPGVTGSPNCPLWVGCDALIMSVLIDFSLRKVKENSKLAPNLLTQMYQTNFNLSSIKYFK